MAETCRNVRNVSGRFGNEILRKKANINNRLIFTVFVAIPKGNISIPQYPSSVYVCMVKRQPSIRIPKLGVTPQVV